MYSHVAHTLPLEPAFSVCVAKEGELAGWWCSASSGYFGLFSAPLNLLAISVCVMDRDVVLFIALFKKNYICGQFYYARSVNEPFISLRHTRRPTCFAVSGPF